MATLTRRKMLKNGGASYGITGVRSSAYFGPKMFTDEPPETIEIDDAAGLAQEDQLSAEKMAKRAERAANREARKAEREALKTARAKAKALRDEAKAILKAAKEEAADTTEDEAAQAKAAAEASVSA